MIFSRFGAEVEIVRVGSAEDVEKLDRRKPDAHDFERIANDCYLVVRTKDDGKERVSDVAYLRADGGLREIMDAVAATLPKEPRP